MVTIGVAVAIPEPWGSELQDYRTAIGDTTATQIPTHITLVPPTEIAADALSGIEDHLRTAATTVEPFRVHLRGTGTFRPVSPVVFVAVAEGIAGCEQLAAAVRRGPLDVDLSFPYHPHVTVAHELGETVLDQVFDDLAGFECRFDVDAFHLYVHEEHHGWQPTQEIPLRCPAPVDQQE
ncbi:2'-5' RNA ligase family protein [Nocardioides dokdonensis]|uniref:2'-5' RNA ligase family protein n=1 Tax=Nocardioides dokdonensis TaxID=450734 RepID=UPI0008319894|nr:2'-5' RNA ligase family protein [Nocardioides dokdonensis]